MDKNSTGSNASEVPTPVLFQVAGVKVTRDHAIGAAVGAFLLKLLSS